MANLNDRMVKPNDRVANLNDRVVKPNDRVVNLDDRVVHDLKQRFYKRRRRKIHYSRPAGLDARNPSVWATLSHAYFRGYMIADSISI